MPIFRITCIPFLTIGNGIVHTHSFIFKYFVFLFTSIVILHILHKVPKKRCPKKKKQNKMLIITHRMTQKGRFECFKIHTNFVYVYLSLGAVPSHFHFRFFHLFIVYRSINIVILMSVFIFHCLFVYRFVRNVFIHFSVL